MINPIYFVLVYCPDAPLTTRHDTLLDYVNGYPGMSLVVSNYVFCHSYSFFSDLFHTITLGFWRFRLCFLLIMQCLLYWC
jgi:hypothetical protein